MKNQRVLLTDDVGFMSSNPTEEPARYVYSIYAGADALALMTAHREFRELDLRRAKERMRTATIVDGRRVFEQSHASGGRVQHFGWTILEQGEVRGLGFVYRGGGWHLVKGVGKLHSQLFLQSCAPIGCQGNLTELKIKKPQICENMHHFTALGFAQTHGSAALRRSLTTFPCLPVNSYASSGSTATPAIINHLLHANSDIA